MKAEFENKVNILTGECERLNALVEKRNREIKDLGGVVQGAQDELRMSAQEQEAYKQRVQKLLAENKGLGEEVR